MFVASFGRQLGSDVAIYLPEQYMLVAPPLGYSDRIRALFSRIKRALVGAVQRFRIGPFSKSRGIAQVLGRFGFKIVVYLGDGQERVENLRRQERLENLRRLEEFL